MALRELPPALVRIVSREARPIVSRVPFNGRRHIASEAIPSEEPSVIDFEDLESESSFTSPFPSKDLAKTWDPVQRAKARRRELPPSRYQYRPPKYFRGPLHPVQSPPTSDPASRLFVPGPFYSPRLEQTYHSTVAQDIMTMTYTHQPPGTVHPPKAPRLREWDDSSPYHKGRPKRGPRGGDVLRMIEHDINFRNIPKIEAVTVHTMVKGVLDDPAYLHVAGLLLQAVTGVRPVVHKTKKANARFRVRALLPISLTSEIRGEDAWGFVDKCVNLVFPQIKDWPGVEGTTGDESGNISFGFSPSAVAMFPEVEINYDMYPPKMIPGFHVTVKTTARSDRHARLLLSALGIPFTGKYVD